MVYLIGWGFPSGGEWIIVAIVAVLLFGKRLPEVGKSLGKGIVEFKKGLRGIEEDVDAGANTATPTPRQADRPALSSEFKYDPQTGKPLVQDESQPTVTRDAPKAGNRFDPYTGQPVSEQNQTSGT